MEIICSVKLIDCDVFFFYVWANLTKCPKFTLLHHANLGDTLFTLCGAIAYLLKSYSFGMNAELVFRFFIGLYIWATMKKVNVKKAKMDKICLLTCHKSVHEFLSFLSQQLRRQLIEVRMASGLKQQRNLTIRQFPIKTFLGLE